jgi:hypothetical protein
VPDPELAFLRETPIEVFILVKPKPPSWIKMTSTNAPMIFKCSVADIKQLACVGNICESVICKTLASDPPKLAHLLVSGKEWVNLAVDRKE